MDYFASMVSYLIVCSSIQGFFLKPWLRSLRWWWVGVNLVSMAIALAAAYGWLYSMVYWAGLDVLQNAFDSFTAIFSSVIVFVLILMAGQWRFLHKRMPSATLWAGWNSTAMVILGGGTLIGSPVPSLLNSQPQWAVALMVVAGAIAGVITGATTQAGCRFLQTREASRNIDGQREG
ncbi:MAG: hypothetical protein WBA57_04045 [Elainellaceae cyanobacterium]